jgi:GNAT superfamily N-acetyltransferase
MPIRFAVVAAHDADTWGQARSLLFAYHQETAVEVGAPRPERPEDVWPPVRQETVDLASVVATYLVAYHLREPVGGVVLVAHDGVSAMLKRCYVVPSWRGRGVARTLVEAGTETAVDRGVVRLVLDVLPSRRGAIAAWRRMGFVEAEPCGDPAMAYFEFRIPAGSQRDWLGLRTGEVALRETDRRWQAVFVHQAELLSRVLAGQAAGIEQVGSTAVEGVVAKPIVDVPFGCVHTLTRGRWCERSRPRAISSVGTRAVRVACCSSSRTSQGAVSSTCTAFGTATRSGSGTCGFAIGFAGIPTCARRTRA